MRYCKECGARLDAGQASCPYCGAPAGQALPDAARPEGEPAVSAPADVACPDGSPAADVLPDGPVPAEAGAAPDACEDEFSVWETAPDDLWTEEASGARRVEPKLPEGWRPPEKREAARRRGKSEPVLSVSAYFWTLLLFFVPVAGQVAAVIWAAGGTRSENRRNLARGFLLCCLLAAVTGVLIYCGMGLLLYRQFGGFFGY